MATAKNTTKTIKKTAPKKKAAPFASLSPTKKRIAIAEDVIAGLKAKRYKATQGTYVSGTVKLNKTMEEIDKQNGPVELKDLLADGLKSCEVCAKGAMFIAAVEKFNNLKINLVGEDNVFDNDGKTVLELDGYDGDVQVCDHLETYFTKDQLDLIELAFEGKDVYSDEIDDLDHAVALTYQFRFKKPIDRMNAIMENIVKNNGKFTPSIA